MSLSIERTLGRLLRSVRAGQRHLACNDPRIHDAPATIRLTSPAFADGAAIPSRHAGAGVGDNLSPALDWSGIPAGTEELLLIMQDPDAPLRRPVVHLIAAGIAPDSKDVPEDGLSPNHGIACGRGPCAAMAPIATYFRSWRCRAACRSRNRPISPPSWARSTARFSPAPSWSAPISAHDTAREIVIDLYQ